MYGLGTAAVRAVTAVRGTRASVCSWALSTALPSATTTLATSTAAAAAAALPCSCRCCCTARTTSLRPMSTIYAWIFVAFVVLLFAAAYRMIKKLSCDDRFIDGNDYHYYNGPEF